MSVSYAAKYSAVVDERFKLGSKTSGALNNSYDWEGVKTVNVYSIPTASMGNYNLAGGLARYGNTTEIEPAATALTVSQDRAFSVAMDKLTLTGTNGAAQAGALLGRQIDEVIIPEIDTYRLAAYVGATYAQHNATKTAITASNAFTSFLKGWEALADEKVPETGRVCYVTPNYFNFLRLDGNFIKASDLAQQKLFNGQVGEVNGTPIIVIPTTMMPTHEASSKDYRVEFIIAHKDVMVSPVKLAEYATYDNPPGLNGVLVQGRVLYDAFCLPNKQKGIYFHYGETEVA